MLEDSNLGGRNQRVRLDLSVHNTTDVRLRLSDPRLGRLLRLSASAFSRPSEVRARVRISPFLPLPLLLEEYSYPYPHPYP